MELAGLAVGVVGLAGLFRSCLAAVDKVQSYRSSGPDMCVLDIRFKAAKARFEQWGQGVGIKQGRLLDDHHSALDDKDRSSAVSDLLHIIIKAICDASDASLRRSAWATGPGDDDLLGSRRSLPPHAAPSESRR